MDEWHPLVLVLTKELSGYIGKFLKTRSLEMNAYETGGF